MGKALVSEHSYSQNIVHLSPWAPCSVLGSRSQCSAFCKYAVTHAYFTSFQRKLLLLKVLVQVWKTNMKNRCERSVCPTWMMYEVYAFKRAQLLFSGGTAGSFWKFGS